MCQVVGTLPLLIIHFLMAILVKLVEGLRKGFHYYLVVKDIKDYASKTVKRKKRPYKMKVGLHNVDKHTCAIH